MSSCVPVHNSHQPIPTNPNGAPAVARSRRCSESHRLRPRPVESVEWNEGVNLLIGPKADPSDELSWIFKVNDCGDEFISWPIWFSLSWLMVLLLIHDGSVKVIIWDPPKSWCFFSRWSHRGGQCPTFKQWNWLKNVVWNCLENWKML